MVNPAPAAPPAAPRQRVAPQAPVAGIDPADALAGDEDGLGEDPTEPAAAEGGDETEALDDLAAETKATRKGSGKDKELDAVRRTLNILETLDEEERLRVIVYLKARLVGATYTMSPTEI